MKKNCLLPAALLCLLVCLLTGQAAGAEGGYSLGPVSPEDGTVPVTAPAACTLAAALYDEHDALLAVQLVPVPAGTNGPVPTDLDLSAPDAVTCKAFLLHPKTGVPLCPAEETDLTSSEVWAVQSADGTVLTFYNTLPEGMRPEEDNVWKVEPFVNDTGMEDWELERPALHPWNSERLTTVVFAQPVSPLSTAY